MTVVTNPINAQQTRASQTQPHNWAKPPIDEGRARLAAMGSKVDRSAVPTNVVELTWKDAVDIVNPLHQIPLVGDVYRTVTGTQISGVARSLGGFLYGGITGGFAAVFAAAYAEAHTGQSPGEQMVAMLIGDDRAPATPAAPATMLADAQPDPNAAPAQIAAKAAVTAHAPQNNLPEDAAPADIAAANNAALAALQQDMQQGATEAAPQTTPQIAPQVFAAAVQQSVDGKTPAAQADAAVAIFKPEPLRERLNKKNASQITTAEKPLEQYNSKNGSFIDRLPANAAQATANQAQNLQLLQGYIDPAQKTAPPLPNDFKPLTNAAPAPTGLAEALAAVTDDAAPDGGTIVSAGTVGKSNPLPLDLVQDMMLQALDKYKNLQKGSADATISGNGFGLQ